MSPEVLTGEGYTEKADIYSLGLPVYPKYVALRNANARRDCTF